MMHALYCTRCANPYEADQGLLLNHKTKFRIKVVQLCPVCCRDCLVGLHTNRRVPFGYLNDFQHHWVKVQ